MANMHVEFKAFFFADHSEPNGYLIHDRRAQACWWYCLCAHGNLAQVDSGAVYEGEPDAQVALSNIIRSVSTVFGISDPAEVLKFIPMCKLEARRSHYDWDERVERPDSTPLKVGAPTQIQ